MAECDVCATEEAALVGAFCTRCAGVLLDAEARRLILLLKAGKDDLKETTPSCAPACGMDGEE